MNGRAREVLRRVFRRRVPDPAWVAFIGGRKSNFAVVRGDGQIRVFGLQDYSVGPEGRLHLNTAYDLDKLRCLESRLPAVVEGKVVLDVGSNNGFFVFKMLEWGAKAAIGWDVSPERVRISQMVASLIDFDGAAVFEVRDFWGQPPACDVVLMLGLVHHLVLRAGGRSLQAVVEHAARFPASTFCIEWVGPRDNSVVKLSRTSGRSPEKIGYAREAFCDALEQCVGEVTPIGAITHHRFRPSQTERELLLVQRRSSPRTDSR